MKNFTILCTLLLGAQLVLGQDLNPVAWDWEAKKLNDTEFELIFTASIDERWYVYSQYIGEDGPIPTSFDYENKSYFTINGKNQESGSNRKEGYDEMFDMNLVKFGGTATFTQKITISNPIDKVSGAFTYMTCDDTRCLPPKEITFEIALN